MSNLQVEQITVNADDVGVLDEWRELLLRAEPQFQLFTPEWYLAWTQTRGATGRWRGRLTALTVRDSRHVLRGLLPLAPMRLGIFNAYGSAGEFEPCRPVLADITSAREVGRELGRGIRQFGLTALQIGPMPDGHPASGIWGTRRWPAGEWHAVPSRGTAATGHSSAA